MLEKWGREGILHRQKGLSGIVNAFEQRVRNLVKPGPRLHRGQNRTWKSRLGSGRVSVLNAILP